MSDSSHHEEEAGDESGMHATLNVHIRATNDDEEEESTDNIESSNENQLRMVKCVCGACLGLPWEINIFQCAVCKQIMEVPPILNEEMTEKLRRRALNQYVVQKAVSVELDNWLDGKETFAEDSNSIVARFYRKLLEFPLFEDKSTGIDKAILDLFLFLPQIEAKLSKIVVGNKRTIRDRFVKWISGPIFYSTFGESLETNLTYGAGREQIASRGDLNDMYKIQFVKLLEMVDHTDGMNSLIEGMEAAHSIEELPGPFIELERMHVAAGASNLEHSLAKKSSSSKLKSLYHIVPRRTIIKLMKMQLGAGLSTAAINLFMTKPFGKRSLMQRMAQTTLGVSDAEARASYLKRQFTPEALARLDCLIAYVEENDIEIFYYGDDDILNFLNDPAVTQRYEVSAVPQNQIDTMRELALKYYQRTKDDDMMSEASSVNPNEGDSSDDSSVDEDDADVDRLVMNASSKPELESEKVKTKTFFARADARRAKKPANPVMDIRHYVLAKMDAKMGSIVVDLLGDKVVDHFLRVTVPILQKHMITRVASQGSGAIELVEGLFDSWKSIIAIHKDRSMSLMTKRKRLKEIVAHIHALTFTLCHNLLRSDSDLKWHRILQWLVDLWHGSRLDIHTDTLLATLPQSVVEGIEKESEVLRIYYADCASRDLGAQPPPEPTVEACGHLITLFRERIVEGLFQQTGTTTFCHTKPQRIVDVPTFHADDCSHTYVSNIEITYDFEDISLMKDRGYERINVDFGVDAQTECSMWIRRSAAKHTKSIDGTELKWLMPITDIRIITRGDQATESHVARLGYVRIAKPVDKRNRYLWYRRDNSSPMIANLTAIYLNLKQSQMNQKTLGTMGYVLLPPPIEPAPKSFFGSLSSALNNSEDKRSVGVYALYSEKCFNDVVSES